MDRIEREILNILVKDDPIATEKTNKHLKSLYEKALFKDVVVSGDKKMGHLGFTHIDHQKHWNIIVDYILQQEEKK